jgi:uncharacterized coiled-coil protein SlyX
LLIRAADDGQGGTDLRLICETTGLVCDVKTHSEQVDSRKVCFEPARKRQALTRLSPHERAALGLRQTMSDLECASHHLDMVVFAVDEHVAGVDADIEKLKQDIAELLARVTQCQQKVYADWHERQPHLDSSELRQHPPQPLNGVSRSS